MALALTLISIVMAYFSPADLVPSLAPYHIQQIIMLPALAVSILSMNMRRASLPYPNFVLLAGFWFAVVMSLLSKVWMRPALDAFIIIGVLVSIYFLVYINAFTLGRVHVMCAVVTLCAVVMAIQGILAYHTGYRAETLLNMKVDEGVTIYKRVCGLGVLHDPNDFAQFLLIGLAFLGVFWSRDNALGSVAVMTAPSLILIYAIYLTFSRGALFGLAAVLAVALSRRIGKLGSLLMGAGLFAMMLAMKFGGGRDISLNEGSAAGRIVAWGAGIAELRQSPVFGVGFGRFTEYNELTAHNSFVLCFAELGLFGYFFWLGLILVTVWGLERLNRVPVKEPGDRLFRRYLTTVRAGLYGFLATAWFLSRTYAETLYIVLALAAVLIFMRRGRLPAFSIRMTRWVPATIALQAASVVIFYVIVRLRTL